jgi:glycosyltransferase involved in cell wall biosynthesis
MSKPRVVVLRGHEANPWDLGVWEQLGSGYDVSVLVTRSNRFDVSSLGVERRPTTALRDLLPKGVVGELSAEVLGDRYLHLDRALEGAAIVHSAELVSWFTRAATRLKSDLGFRLVLTVWETIPLVEAYRPSRVHAWRAAALAAADLYIAPTERSRDALLLEGVDHERVIVSPPGIDLSRFRAATAAEGVEGHLIVSPGRLVWEKGHQDVIRAIALIRRGIAAPGGAPAPRLLIVGRGPEEARLRAHAEELGVGDLVEIRAVPYEEMPGIFASASCMVLASIPRTFSGPGLRDSPRSYWEEQFGMVLAEAMATGIPILAAASGAIPEVTRNAVPLFPPGDWQELARLLAAGPLTRPAGERVDYDPSLLESYSVEAAAARIATAYERVLELPDAGPTSFTQSS